MSRLRQYEGHKYFAFDPFDEYDHEMQFFTGYKKDGTADDDPPMAIYSELEKILSSIEGVEIGAAESLHIIPMNKDTRDQVKAEVTRLLLAAGWKECEK